MHCLYFNLLLSLHLVITKETIEKRIQLKNDEKKWLVDSSPLPLLVTDFFFSLIDPDDPDDPIRRQVIPSVLENSLEDMLDPLKEVDYSVTERLIHHYTNRCALLTTDRCFTYCRHCFRRRFTGTSSGPISEKQIDDAMEYLKEHAEVKELLLTGGDLFTLSDERLDYLFSSLRRTREDIIQRLCTRAVATNPERFTTRLMDIIRKHNHGAPFILMTQFNHPRELNERSIAAVSAFIDMGIPAFNQSVLLKGVNDDVDVLEELSNKLLFNRIKPYYLFQGDQVCGTRHLRVDVVRGLELEEELRKRVSGLAMPQYTADLPQGGGKVILTRQYLKEIHEDHVVFTTPDGEERSYPR